MAEVEVDDKGRVLIPGAIRKELGLEEGQRLRVEVAGGKVVLSRALTMDEALDRLEGAISRHRQGPPRTDPRKLKDLWTEKLPPSPRRRRARR